MDIEVRGGGSLIAPFLQRYRESIDDASARRYARYAARLVWHPLQPFILIISGLTGSGKSTLARELSERMGVPTINSDVVRKELAGKQGRQPAPYNQGIYSARMTEKLEQIIMPLLVYNATTSST